jgi:hypothetical protein
MGRKDSQTFGSDQCLGAKYFSCRIGLLPVKGLHLSTHQRKSKIYAIYTPPFHLNGCPGFGGKLAGSNCL